MGESVSAGIPEESVDVNLGAIPTLRRENMRNNSVGGFAEFASSPFGDRMFRALILGVPVALPISAGGYVLVEGIRALVTRTPADTSSLPLAMICGFGLGVTVGALLPTPEMNKRDLPRG